MSECTRVSVSYRTTILVTTMTGDALLGMHRSFLVTIVQGYVHSSFDDVLYVRRATFVSRRRRPSS